MSNSSKINCIHNVHNIGNENIKIIILKFIIHGKAAKSITTAIKY